VSYEDATNSAWKALSLILFASKNESKMKMNQFVSTHDAGKVGTSEAVQPVRCFLQQPEMSSAMSSSRPVFRSSGQPRSSRFPIM
jgi:hypothetical protein